MVTFIRKLQHRVTSTGPAYRLSVPREVVEELGLREGGLCSLSVRGREIVMQAYTDTSQPYMKRWKPPEKAGESGIYDAPLKPLTHGPSRPWPVGEVLGRFVLDDWWAARLHIEQQIRLLWPSRRGRKPRRKSGLSY